MTLFQVRFGTLRNAPLMGHFPDAWKAKWWAEKECDGQRFTIHEVTT